MGLGIFSEIWCDVGSKVPEVVYEEGDDVLVIIEDDVMW